MLGPDGVRGARLRERAVTGVRGAATASVTARKKGCDMNGGEILMRPEEAQIGKRVRVSNDHRRTKFRGQEGVIAKSWGNPGYPALDVLLDDGVWQLFWYHELEPLHESDRGVSRQNGAIENPVTLKFAPARKVATSQSRRPGQP
jgi:hypothetical protein